MQFLAELLGGMKARMRVTEAHLAPMICWISGDSDGRHCGEDETAPEMLRFASISSRPFLPIKIQTAPFSP